MKILVVEDDTPTAVALTEALTAHNYIVNTVADGQTGLQLVQNFEYDLIVLDIMLPSLDGISICQQLRSQQYQMPIMVLSAKNSSIDKVMGLNAGASEEYLGKVLPSHRSNVFLASKTYEKNRDGVWRELERSLKRLKTDYLDLWQLHSIAFPEQLKTIFSPSGAIKALEEIQQQKLVRFVGITGHREPDVMIEALRRYSFHTALIPVNAADKHHPRPYFPGVLEVAQKQNVGVIAMKVPAYGKLFQAGGLTSMLQAFNYSLSQPGVHCCIISADNVKQLEENAWIASIFRQLNDTELAAIEERTAKIWQDTTFYRAWG
jgi:aryl-alcohol dehydrogenase-like predicted oxidoreductase